MNVFDKLVQKPLSPPAEKFIRALKEALREYERETKTDGRHQNGRKRVDPRMVDEAIILLDRGWSIRQAAKKCGISFGTLWKAKEKKT